MYIIICIISQRIIYSVYYSCTAVPVPTGSTCLAATLRHGRESGFTWCAHASDRRFYRYRRRLVRDVSGVGYVRVCDRRRTVFLLLLFCSPPPFPTVCNIVRKPLPPSVCVSRCIEAVELYTQCASRRCYYQ